MHRILNKIYRLFFWDIVLCRILLWEIDANTLLKWENRLLETDSFYEES